LAEEIPVSHLQNIKVEGCIGSGKWGEVYKGIWQETPVARNLFFVFRMFVDFDI